MGAEEVTACQRCDVLTTSEDGNVANYVCSNCKQPVRRGIYDWVVVGQTYDAVCRDEYGELDYHHPVIGPVSSVAEPRANESVTRTTPQ